MFGLKDILRTKLYKNPKFNFIKNTWQIIGQKWRELARKRKSMWVARSNVKMKTFY